METKRRILEAAVAVFARKGMNGATVDEIAAEGGVNKHVVLPDEYQTADGSTIASGKSVKLTVIYKDNAYYMYLDGVCYLTVTGDEAAAVKTAIGTEGDIAIKLVSEHHAAFSNVILSTDVVEIESYLSAHSGS